MRNVREYTTVTKNLNRVPITASYKICLVGCITLRAIAALNRKAPEGANMQNWCSAICSLLLEHATELQHDSAFTELAESLNLRGDLLAV